MKGNICKDKLLSWICDDLFASFYPEKRGLNIYLTIQYCMYK